jgi:replication fork protection complex subunit Csm3/Swi3
LDPAVFRSCRRAQRRSGLKAKATRYANNPVFQMLSAPITQLTPFLFVQFSDAARLLSFYQLWLDDLFPKAKFVDALAMVEKVGHKKQVVIARNEYINGSRPRGRAEEFNVDDDDEDLFGDAETSNPTTGPTGAAAASGAASRPRTPPAMDNGIPDDEDLYDATPRAPRPVAQQAPPSQSDDMPDDDELDALMAEYGAPGEAVLHPSRPRQQPPQPPSQAPQQSKSNQDDDDDMPDDDDLDALLAEAEEFDRGKQTEVPIRSDARAVPSQGGAKPLEAQEAAKDSRADSQPQEEELEGLWD